MTSIYLFWKFSPEITYLDAVVIMIMLAVQFGYACRLELVSVLMLQNVNNFQYFEAYLH